MDRVDTADAKVPFAAVALQDLPWATPDSVSWPGQRPPPTFRRPEAQQRDIHGLAPGRPAVATGPSLAQAFE